MSHDEQITPAQGFLYDRVTSDVPQLGRGQVWCYVCGFTQRVQSSECLRHGWPKCCGQTMGIDSPEERRRLEAKR